MIDFLTGWLGSLPTFMTPLLLASLGLLICERAGVLNLGVEGVMAVAAMTGAAACLTGIAPPVAVFLAAGAALLVTLPYILAVVVFRAPQIPAGLALVAIGLGASMALGRDFAHKPFVGLRDVPMPGFLTDLPVIGRMIFRQDFMVYAAIALAVLIALFLFRTKGGLMLRATGEDPATADTAGVDVSLVQALALAAGSLLIGLGGGYLSVAGSQIWTEGMVAGRGWIALALVVFVQWSPTRAIAGAALFGGAQALIPRLQALGLEVPIYLLSMFPYVLTIAVLIFASRRAQTRQQEPRGLGQVFIRQDR